MSDDAEHRTCPPARMREPVADGRLAKRLLSAAGLLAALAASSCCLLPFVLFTLGVSGAWISNLTALAPFQPSLVVLAVALLGAGFYRVYRQPKIAACVPGSACAAPRADRVTKSLLWSATALVAAGIAFPWMARLLIEM